MPPAELRKKPTTIRIKKNICIAVSLNSALNKITANAFVISGDCVVLPSCSGRRSMADDCTLHLNRNAAPCQTQATMINPLSVLLLTSITQTRSHADTSEVCCNFSTFYTELWRYALR